MAEGRRSAEGGPVVICGLDDNYLMCASAMLKSLETNLRKYETAHVYLLHDNLSDAHKHKIEQSIGDRIFLTWTQVPHDKLVGLKVDGHVSIATYYRLFVETLLPHLRKVIYLDCDTIINQDLSLLWDSSLDGNPLSAVPQVSPGAMTAGSPRGLRTYRELGIDVNSRLFNAGVLLIDLDRWRADRVSRRVLNYLRDYRDQVLWWDQDGLNAILAGRWTPLDYRWNVMTSIFRYYDTWRDSQFTRGEYLNIITDPHIIHYNSTQKPWHHGYALPYKETFFRYLDRTEWCGWRPMATPG